MSICIAVWKPLSILYICQCFGNTLYQANALFREWPCSSNFTYERRTLCKVCKSFLLKSVN